MISANYAEMRIDLDAEESVHHVKTDNLEDFGLFLEQLQQHRLYTQNISNNGQVHDLMLADRHSDQEVGYKSTILR